MESTKNNSSIGPVGGKGGNRVKMKKRRTPKGGIVKKTEGGKKGKMQF